MKIDDALKQVVIKRKWIIVLSIIFSVLFIFPLLRNHIQSDFSAYLPNEMPIKKSNEKIKSLFGSNDIHVVLFKSDSLLNYRNLQFIKKISDQLENTPQIQDITTPFTLKTATKKGIFISSEALIKKIPTSKEQERQLIDRLKKLQQISSTVFNSDYNTIAFYITPQDTISDKECIDSIQPLLCNPPKGISIYQGGIPYARYFIAHDINRDMALLLPLGIVIMLIMLRLFFKQQRGVWLPFCIVIFSLLIAMGLLPLLGWEISVITILLPILCIAIANDYGIHIIAHYQELNKEGTSLSPKELAFRCLKDLISPITLTALTTIAGLLGLITHILLPAKQLAVLAAVGIFVAFVLSLLFIPAVLSLLSNKRKIITSNSEKHTHSQKLLISFSKHLLRYPKQYIVFNILFILIISSGIFVLKSDANIENFFNDKHPVQIGAQEIKNSFGGTQLISLIVNTDLSKSENMSHLENLNNEISKLEYVSKSTSICQIIKGYTKIQFSPKSKYYNKLPENNNLLNRIYKNISLGNRSMLDKLITQDKQHAQILIHVDGSSTETLKVYDDLQSFKKQYPEISDIGGTALFQAQLAQIIIKGQKSSLLLALLIVSLIMTVVFRSWKAGLICLIPIGSSIATLFGLMGIFHIKLDMATAMLSSILIGVGVDYSIHILHRIKKEREEGRDWNIAIAQTLITTGRGVLFNALSVVIGFSVTLFSAFSPIRNFGFLITISILSCVINAFVFIPTLSILFKPKFMNPKR